MSRTRTIVVTGAGGGLGRALVREALTRGDQVAGIGRDAEALAESGRGAERFLPLIADVTDAPALAGAIDAAQACFGRIDALIANAAIYPRGTLIEQDPAEWMRTLAVNVGGVAFALRAVLPHMIAEAHGRIIVVGSYADVAPIPESSAYSASKGAVHALVRAAAVEVGTDLPDILVNEWVPGALATRMGVPEGHDPELAARWGIDLLDLPSGGPTGRIFLENRPLDVPQPRLKRLAKKLLGR